MSGERKELAATDRTVIAEIETAEGQDDSRQVVMEDIFGQLVLQSNFAAHEAEAELQVEEKGNVVADLQGFCAGIRNFKSNAKDAGFDLPPAMFDTANRMTPWVRTLDNSETGDDTECELDLAALTEFSRQLDTLTGSTEYAALEQSMQDAIRAKKDFLYAEAKTSRDLFWTHGWHRGFTWVQTQIKELNFWKGVKEQQAAKRAKEKESELPFGDDDE